MRTIRPSPAFVPASTGNENASQNVSVETFIQDINPPDILDDQASALTQLAEHYLETANKSSPHTSLSEKYQVLLHINAINEAHIDHQINQGDICHVENNKFLSREVARQLACDTHMRVVLEDDDGKILNIGRKSRTIPRAIAHALNIRDGGCRYQHKSLIYLDYIDDIEDFQSAIAAWGENPGIDNLPCQPAFFRFFVG